MMQAASDPVPTIGGPAGVRNGPAIGIIAGALLAHALLFPLVMLPRGRAWDFFAMYNFARVRMTGHSPYETGAVNYDHPVFRDAARDYFKWFSNTDKTRGSSDRRREKPFGLFYPPQAYLIFLPFSRIPWYPALACWTVFMTLAVLACGSLTWTFDRELQGRSPAVEALVIAAFLLNPITELHLSQGQTTLLMCAGVALGQWARRKGYFWPAAFFWSFAAIKPQLGILLCGVTLFAGGWRFCVATALMTIGLNVVGGLATTGDPLMMMGLWKGGQAHVEETFFNTVRNADIISWVRVVYALTGYEIALTPMRNLAGIFFWIGLVLATVWPRGGLRWALPYWLATAAVGSLVFGLSHAYDLVMLILLVPYLFWLYDRGHQCDWIFVTALIALAAIPMSAPRGLASWLSPGMAAEVLASHRTFLVLILAVYLLIRGQPAEAHAPRAGKCV